MNFGIKLFVAALVVVTVTGCARQRYVAPACAVPPPPALGGCGSVNGTCAPSVQRPWTPAETYNGADFTTCRTYY